MTVLEVVHTTRYRYARPVSFGRHRALLRPRDSHDLRLREATLLVRPEAEIRWAFDVFGNSVTLLDFAEPADELSIRSRLVIAHYPAGPAGYPVAPEAEYWPFAYAEEELVDLRPTIARHYPDPEGAVAAWGRRLAGEGGMPTLALLEAITRSIKDTLRYVGREEKGTQPPAVTIEKGTGSCRDYALLMIEIARSLGLGARFVSGYLHDPALDGEGAAMQGSGATHAWAQVYVPGAGWVEFDPTNGIVGGQNLIRIGVARDPTQAVPVSGRFVGTAADYRGMDVEVRVRRVEPAAPLSAPAPADAG